MSDPLLDETHDPARGSWVPGADGHPDFPIQNLPLGIFSNGGGPRGGVAIGDHILNLAALADTGLLDGEALAAARAASGATLNPLLAMGAGPRRALRRRLSAILSDTANRAVVSPLLHAAADCTLHLPAAIGDYTDFYVGIHHATAVGALFRPDDPLLPNYKHVPIGYHGRASTVRVSGEPVRRPRGQTKAPDAAVPTFGPTRRLDYELELGVWIGADADAPVAIGAAHGYVAGLTLLNDWSARDVQAWEYQPLGPFLSKSFHTSVSPWLVTAEALAPFRIAQPARPAGDPRPLPYLDDAQDQARGAFAIDLSVSIASAAMRDAGHAPHVLGRSRAADMYWTVAQMVAHHSSNGCKLRAGDLLGTGTLSGAGADARGSLLEASEGGRTPVRLPTGETRSFLEDGDELTLSATARADGAIAIGFGPCTARILPATS